MADYPPSMFQCKRMTVDGLQVSVGSTNFDNRSFRLNDEATLNVLDADLVALQTAIFEADWAQSRRVSIAQLQARPFKEKMVSKSSDLLTLQL